MSTLSSPAPSCVAARVSASPTVLSGASALPGSPSDPTGDTCRITPASHCSVAGSHGPFPPVPVPPLPAPAPPWPPSPPWPSSEALAPPVSVCPPAPPSSGGQLRVASHPESGWQLGTATRPKPSSCPLPAAAVFHSPLRVTSCPDLPLTLGRPPSAFASQVACPSPAGALPSGLSSALCPPGAPAEGRS